MAKVKVLVEGYARARRGYYKAMCTTTLIEDRGKRMIVDPGCNRDLLRFALAHEGLRPKNIDLIFLTHYHPDHLLNIVLFPRTEILDGDTIYKDDKESHFSSKIPNTDIEIIATPGHAYEHATPLVKTDEGIVAVAGDLWWWEDGEQKTDPKSLLTLKDPWVKDAAALLKSRKAVLKKADLIIPGHGKAFAVEK